MIPSATAWLHPYMEITTATITLNYQQPITTILTWIYIPSEDPYPLIGSHCTLEVPATVFGYWLADQHVHVQ